MAEREGTSRRFRASGKERHHHNEGQGKHGGPEKRIIGGKPGHLKAGK